TTVRFSFAGSQQLAEQISLGAPADVFASANKRLMDVVVKAGRVNEGDLRVFTQNRLVVVFPKSNPAGIETLQDLSKSAVKLVLAAPTVPVGAYSLEFLKKASTQPEFGANYSPTVLANVVSYEADVRAVFSKVALGEADAGIVYSSDVLADKANEVATPVDTIDIPNDLNTIASYPIAPLKDSPNLPLATAFVDYVLSPDGQTVLRKYGFLEVK
ncbi:MAG: molybdate ABC transporter substrate-binding protein, partial [Anaerolineae bacterium]|nr:molybdate ABC transporter substrate-binding protein [Anaerolineae bacterium]